MTYSDGEYTLSSGRVLRPYAGIFGLFPAGQDATEARLSEGYDRRLEIGQTEQPDWVDEQILTADERKEIARYMMREWALWAGIAE